MFVGNFCHRTAILHKVWRRGRRSPKTRRDEPCVKVMSPARSRVSFRFASKVIKTNKSPLYSVCILYSVCSLQSAFYTSSAFYTQSAFCILHSAFCILHSLHFILTAKQDIMEEGGQEFSDDSCKPREESKSTRA